MDQPIIVTARKAQLQLVEWCVIFRDRAGWQDNGLNPLLSPTTCRVVVTVLLSRWSDKIS